MKKEKPNPLDEWVKTLTSPTLGKAVDIVPEGWLTTEQVAERLRVSRETAIRKIRVAQSKGLAKERSFRIMTRSRVYPVPHFLLINQPEPGSK